MTIEALLLIIASVAVLAVALLAWQLRGANRVIAYQERQLAAWSRARLAATRKADQ